MDPSGGDESEVGEDDVFTDEILIVPNAEKCFSVFRINR